MEVIYNEGGLYLDNDQFVDMDCIKKILCPIKDGLHFLDWTDKARGVWYKSVPISFIYSPFPKNPILNKIMTSYN